MNKFIKILCYILCLNCTLASAKIKNDFKAKVINVYDGDSITILSEIPCNQNSYKKNNKFKCKNGVTQYKVRLFGIDAPEIGQAFGEQSKKMLSNLIFNKIVLVKPISIDIYKRLVANIYLNNVWINAKMVEKAGAWNYRKYNNDYTLLDIEKKARSKKIGIWSLPKSEQIPPWDWRKQNHNKQQYNNLFKTFKY